MPDIPNLHSALVMCLTLIALFLFSRERLPLESSSLLVIVVLTLGFELFPFVMPEGQLRAVDFFLGFGHEALVAVCALMIVGHGLVRTGALEPIGRFLSRVWSVSPAFSLLLTLVFGAILSAFVNNTPVVVLLLPILISVSLRTHTQASSVLMPMGFATLVGGMATTIGTSTNLLVVSVANDLGLERMGMFDFALPAAIAGSVGILYLWLIAPRLLPERETVLQDTSPRIFSAWLSLPEGSPVAGSTLADALEKTGKAMHVQKIYREDGSVVLPLPDMILREGDRLAVRDTPQKLKEFEEVLGAMLYSGDMVVDEEHPLMAEDQQLAEVLVTQSSPLLGNSLKALRFADRYQLVILALHRQGRALTDISSGVENQLLRIGDILLVQGDRQVIADLKREGSMLVLDATTDLPYTSKAPMALGIMGGVILLAAFGILPISISALAGALMMVVTGCLAWRDVGRALSAQVILIVVASLALGSALTHTGSTEYLAAIFLYLVGGASPSMMLSCLILLMAILTNIVSNNAAAVIGTPIAISIANSLALAPEPFVLAVLFGANMSFATPMAYKTNLLVMNAGGYRFIDFVRIGVPLTLIMWVILSITLPVIYGLI